MSATTATPSPPPARAVRRYLRQAKPCPYGGKNSYRTKRKALRIAESRRRLSDTKLRVYRCPNCDFWHLTSQDPSTRGTA